jgi:hypothetical protein
MADRIILVGAGRFAQEIADLAADAEIEVAGTIEGIDPGRADSNAVPPIVWVDDQGAFEPDLPIVPAIGSPRRRDLMERIEAEGRRFATLVHPSAVVARSAVLEPGCVIFPNVVVGARSIVGQPLAHSRLSDQERTSLAESRSGIKRTSGSARSFEMTSQLALGQPSGLVRSSSVTLSPA